MGMRGITRLMAGTGLFAGITAATPAAANVDIVFDYSRDTNGFFSLDNPDGALRRARLDQAASYYEVFTDKLSAIAPGAGDNWAPTFFHPATGNITSVFTNPTIPQNQILVFAGGRNLTTPPGETGNAPLGIGGPGGYADVFGSAAFVNAVENRGQGVTTGQTANDFGPWGGSITFDTVLDNDTEWHFGAGPPSSADQADFLTVAIHELGHLLGFGYNLSDSFTNNVSNEPDNDFFFGLNSTTLYGQAVPLSEDLSHWLDGVTSDGRATAMDPVLTLGTRSLLTPLDYAGFADIGWQVPEPATAGVLGTASGLLLLRRRRAAV